MTEKKHNAIIIATEGITTNLLFEQLSKEMVVKRVFIEPSESRITILKRRMKKLGIFNVIGQVLFMIIALPFIPKRKKRIHSIINSTELKNDPIPLDCITKIASVHNKSLPELIKSENPDLIVINGTRILRKNLLEKLTVPCVNIHVGITPKYRGVHGGFWAIYQNDLALFGVTLHHINTGIDTGKIIAQKTLQPNVKDNFKTYPILQYCEGLKLLRTHLDAILNQEKIECDLLTKESQLHYHPTLWQYLKSKS